MAENFKDTLYVNNLNEKVPITEIQLALGKIFCKFGDIKNISIKRNIRMRGQAFVSFVKPDDAKKALLSLQSFPLYGKPMRIEYAKKNYSPMWD